MGSGQLGHFLEGTDADRLAPLWRLYALTDMRRGEALALRWRDVDLSAGKLHVQRSRTKDGYAVVERPPKTGRGRTINIDPETVQALTRQTDQQLADEQEWGSAWVAGDYVFTREDGQPWHPDRVYVLFGHAVRATDLPRLLLRVLRHRHATLALQADINSKVVQERPGHASIKQTMDTYSHVFDVLHESTADLIENLNPSLSRDVETGAPEA